MKKNNYSHENSSNFLNGIIIGALIGVAASALFISPDKEKNQKKAKKALKDAKDTIQPVLEEAKPYVSEFAQETSHAVMQLANIPLEEIKTRIKKANKNASSRNYFRGKLS